MKQISGNSQSYGVVDSAQQYCGKKGTNQVKITVQPFRVTFEDSNCGGGLGSTTPFSLTTDLGSKADDGLYIYVGASKSGATTMYAGEGQNQHRQP